MIKTATFAATLFCIGQTAVAEVTGVWGYSLGFQIDNAYPIASVCRVVDEIDSFADVSELFADYLTSIEMNETMLTAECQISLTGEMAPVFHKIVADRGVFATLILDFGQHYRSTGKIKMFQRILNRQDYKSRTVLDMFLLAHEPALREGETSASVLWKKEAKRAFGYLCLFGAETNVYAKPQGCETSDNL